METVAGAFRSWDPPTPSYSLANLCFHFEKETPLPQLLAGNVLPVLNTTVHLQQGVDMALSSGQ